MISTYTLSTIMQRTGAKRRAIQLWADGGVIHGISNTDRAGTGVHRLFTGAEVTVAALLVPLANMGVPIGHLKVLAEAVRPIVNVTYETGQVVIKPAALRQLVGEYKELVLAFRRAARGEGENQLCFAMSPNEIWVSVKTDANAPICIDPTRDFPASLKAVRPAPPMIVLNLTDLLFGLLDQ